MVNWLNIVVMVKVSIRVCIVIGVVRFLIEETVRAIPMMVFGFLGEVSVIAITKE